MPYIICSEFTYDSTQPLGFPIREKKRFIKEAESSAECEDSNCCVIDRRVFNTLREAEAVLKEYNKLYYMIGE